MLLLTLVAFLTSTKSLAAALPAPSDSPDARDNNPYTVEILTYPGKNCADEPNNIMTLGSQSVVHGSEHICHTFPNGHFLSVSTRNVGQDLFKKNLVLAFFATCSTDNQKKEFNIPFFGMTNKAGDCHNIDPTGYRPGNLGPINSVVIECNDGVNLGGQSC